MRSCGLGCFTVLVADEEKGPGGTARLVAEYLGYRCRPKNVAVGRAVSAADDCDSWFSLQSLTGHTTPIESLQINTSEELIVAGSQSGSIRVWDLGAAKSMFREFSFLLMHTVGDALPVLAQELPSVKGSRSLALLSP